MIEPTTSYIWTDLVLRSIRDSLRSAGFVEILPAILSERFEPGARHSIAVLGDRDLPLIEENSHHNHKVRISGHRFYYLPVSHAVEKQLALEHLSRVYCLTPCIRLVMDGEEVSGRHLYTFFQIEIEWQTTSVEEVFKTAEQLLSRFAKRVLRNLPQELRHGAAVNNLRALCRVPFPRVAFNEAVKIVRGAAPDDRPNPQNANDLTHAEELALGERYKKPLWLYDYPEGVRDSLYRRNARGFYDTYDLILPFSFGELATGGLRPESSSEIIRQSKMLGKTFHTSYADWKERAGVQTGGFGIGLERLIRFCAAEDSVLSFTRYHDSGPNQLLAPSKT